MTEKSRQNQGTRHPMGFTRRSRGLSGEYAHEQGWGLNQEERSKTSTTKQNFDGGRDYDYGPRDFGDSAVDTSRARPHSGQSKKATTGKGAHRQS